MEHIPLKMDLYWRFFLHFVGFSPTSPKPPPPTNVDYVFFTVPIMAYIMKGGNGGLREGFRKKTQKKCGPVAHFGGGGLDKYLPVHNSIVIFGKLSLGGN